MNKYQEAFEDLCITWDEEGMGKDHFPDQYPYLYNTIKELVDKETPHSLSYEGDGYDPTDGELVYDIAICDCGREFEFEYEEHYKYCPNCGRKLDWSDIDD